ncbi:hypothetical protein HUU40_30130 [candidate division KSB1 bacterium]|nr:hypothetical protein [candidate division KSB1 bacterium]
MTINKPFEHGVLGVLHGTWEIELLSPLAIRNGDKIAFKQKEKRLAKGRGTNLALAWSQSETVLANQPDEYSKIADCNYHFALHHGQVHVEYSIPASSIRGALRNTAIKRWVEWSNRKTFSLPNKEDKTINLEERMQRAKAELQESKNGWYDILSLFGCAFDLGEDNDNPLTWAGRMRLSTQINSTTAAQPLNYMGKTLAAQDVDGPQNVQREVAVRNPIDRVTMAAKDGGLHGWLEISPGQCFTLSLQILNPCPKDLELLDLWFDEINQGYLCFGGLTSQGRGRVAIKTEEYELFVSKASALADKLLSANKPPAEKKDPSLQGLWVGAKIKTRDELRALSFENLPRLKGNNGHE